MVRQDNKTIKRLQTIFLILLVVTVGSAIFGKGLSYYYSIEERGGSCGLCFELNPQYDVCENAFYGENVIFNVTLDYGKEDGP